MTRAHMIIAGSLLALLLSGCASHTATGLSGNAMLAGGLPKLIIEPAPPLRAVAQGTTWGVLKTDTNLQATAQVAYAIYGDESESGPVPRHGHVMINRLDQRDFWMFNVESLTRRNEAYLATVRKNDLDWTEHLLYENSQGDWFSDYWVANGRTVPEAWIGKRWSRTYSDTTRVVVEYREPMPACLEAVPGGGYVAHVNFVSTGADCERWLKEFHARADAAFSIQSSRGLEIAPEPAAASKLRSLPPSRPDMTRLVGTVQAADKLEFGSSW